MLRATSLCSGYGEGGLKPGTEYSMKLQLMKTRGSSGLTFGATVLAVSADNATVDSVEVD